MSDLNKHSTICLWLVLSRFAINTTKIVKNLSNNLIRLGNIFSQSNHKVSVSSVTFSHASNKYKKNSSISMKLTLPEALRTDFQSERHWPHFLYSQSSWLIAERERDRPWTPQNEWIVVSQPRFFIFRWLTLRVWCINLFMGSLKSTHAWSN